MVELAIQTGIPVAVWADESAETIATAVDILKEIAMKRRR